MDKRLKLTDKQQSLVKQLEKLFNDLKKEKVGIVLRQDDCLSLGFYNESEVLTTIWDDNCYFYDEDQFENYKDECSDEEAEEGQIWYTPGIRDFTPLPINVVNACTDNWFAVLLEKNEDTDKYIIEKEKARMLAPLLEKIDKLKKKMNKIENAVADGEASIRQLEEKGVPQEIINEEKANLESNKKIIEKMQEDIKALNSEIRKIEST
jgi:hypothetical protein